MGSVIKTLIPTRWRLKIRRFHKELWTPELYVVDYQYGGWAMPDYYLPRATFFPRKNEPPVPFHKLSDTDCEGHALRREDDEGVMRATPYAVLKYTTKLTVMGVVGFVILMLGIPLALGLVPRIIEGINTCGGVLEDEAITPTCAEERGMTVEEYKEWRESHHGRK